MQRSLAIVAVLSAASLPAYPQAEAPAFRAADVHVSSPARNPFFEGFGLHGDHFSLLHATMVDLIGYAYGIDRTNVQGGPPWLERDRFDILATAPATTSRGDLKLMLQSVLTQRFGLAVHTGEMPMPAYFLTVIGGGSKLKPSAGGDVENRCDFKPQMQASGAISYFAFSCRNTTMDALAENLRQWAGGSLPNPVINSTNLKGGFDFDIRWSDRGSFAQQGADAIGIFDAVEKQLGLRLELRVAPRTVTIVDRVNEQPAPNPPGVEKLVATAPRTLEVATVKPSKPGTPLMFRATLDQIIAQGATLRRLMDEAWDLSFDDNEVPVNAPKWFDTDKFDILASILNEDPRNA